ncbi:MAG: hypothetical protein [Bat faecal associated chuvirus 2]|nr:MAG: hypothetical protein [Bat faecal associated chuvirus 2]
MSDHQYLDDNMDKSIVHHSKIGWTNDGTRFAIQEDVTSFHDARSQAIAKPTTSKITLEDKADINAKFNSILEELLKLNKKVDQIMGCSKSFTPTAPKVLARQLTYAYPNKSVNS